MLASIAVARNNIFLWALQLLLAPFIFTYFLHRVAIFFQAVLFADLSSRMCSLSLLLLLPPLRAFSPVQSAKSLLQKFLLQVVQECFLLSSGRSADCYADQPPPAAGGGTVGEKRADRCSEPGRPGTTKAYYVYVFFLRLSVRLSSVSLLCALLVFFFGGFFHSFFSFCFHTPDSPPRPACDVAGCSRVASW